MDLRSQILYTHSKENTDQIVAWVGKDTERFNELMNLFLNGNSREVQLSAEAISKCILAQQKLSNNIIGVLIDKCYNGNSHPAIRRNVMRIFQAINIPKKDAEAVMNISFDFLSDKNEAIAVRAFSMGTLLNLTKLFPELKEELKLVIEHILEFEDCSAGIKSKGKNVLAALGK